MTSFHASYRPATNDSDTHVRVQLFAGPDADHRALTGELVLTREEAVDFLTRINGISRRATIAYPTRKETRILPPIRHR